MTTTTNLLPDLVPGVYADVPEDAYHADRRTLSHSGAKLLLDAPAKFRWQQDHPPESKPEYEIGSAVHAVVLGSGPELVVHEPDPKYKSPKSTNAWKDEKKKVEQAGGILLLREEYDEVLAMAKSVREHPMAAELLADGQPEVSAYAQDETTGVWLRARFDWLNGSTAVDLKTSYDADPDEFGSKAAKLDYAMQDSWYRHVAERAGQPITGFAFVLVEKTAPYLVSVCVLDQDAVDWGGRRGARAREIYRDCVESGVWPGYQPDGGFTVVSLPQWALRDESI